MHHSRRTRGSLGLWLAGLVSAGFCVALAVHAQDMDKRVLEAEAKRVAVVDKVKPAVVAILAPGGNNGGSGVVIDKDGYVLTNFHVVEATGPVMKCGLPDGILYDGVLVGLDKVGDVALVKLIAKEKDKPFPFAPLGDSDKVRAGDWSLAMGNPFLLATDFNPTVTYGLVSGVHRYQYPAGTLLEYTDCIQIDTSINPGNSGGPLFNMDGELIGINGRGSFEKRGRVNSGVGYAISINQIKNFLGHLRAGIDTDHATLGAYVDNDQNESVASRVVVTSVLDESDVHRRGLETDDEVVSFAGRPVTSKNQYKNVLGIFPKGWRVPMVYRRNNVKHEILARLMQLQPTATDDQKPKPRPMMGRPQPAIPAELAKLYQPKAGYANYHFNKLEQDRLLADFAKHGNFSAVQGTWDIEGQADAAGKKSSFKFTIGEEDDRTADGKPVVRAWTYHLKPETLPAVPEAEEGDEKLPLRVAVRKAAAALRKHANTFPQEILGKDDAELKDQAAKVEKDTSAALKELQETLDQLKKVGNEKEESRLWHANYDFNRARLTAFVAYAMEYNHLLDLLKKGETPKRDPKVHRGYRMAPDPDLSSGADAKRLADEAKGMWTKMTADYKDTVWDDRAQDGKKIQVGLKWQPAGGTKTLVRLKLGEDRPYELDPLKVGQDLNVLKDPPRSGGILAALYQYRRFLTSGNTGFEGGFYHGGNEPIYPPTREKKSFKDVRVDTAVLHTEHAAVPVKWYFSLKDNTLLGFEVTTDKEDDPCEVYLSDYRVKDGRLLPHRFDIRYGNDVYGTFTVTDYKLGAAK
jgi:S1-C subfamily serine protease